MRPELVTDYECASLQRSKLAIIRQCILENRFYRELQINPTGFTSWLNDKSQKSKPEKQIRELAKTIATMTNDDPFSIDMIQQNYSHYDQCPIEKRNTPEAPIIFGICFRGRTAEEEKEYVRRLKNSAKRWDCISKITGLVGIASIGLTIYDPQRLLPSTASILAAAPLPVPN